MSCKTSRSRLFERYRKLPKINPRGLYFSKAFFWGAYFWRGLSTEGNLRFKIDWASLIAGSKFTAPGGLIFRGGDLTEGFLRYRFRGLIFGGAYTWRGLFSEFSGNFVYLNTFQNNWQYFRSAVLSFLTVSVSWQWARTRPDLTAA